VWIRILGEDNASFLSRGRIKYMGSCDPSRASPNPMASPE
jgi:hypothetical protein